MDTTAKLSRSPSRRSQGPVRSETSRLEILAGAKRVLDRDGADALTIESVAREARASKPTIYKWWGDKQSLLSEVYRLETPIRSEVPSHDASALGQIASFYTHLWKIWNDDLHAQTTRWLFKAAINSKEATASYRDDYLEARKAPIVSLLIQAKARNELHERADTELMLDLLTGYHMLRVLLGKPVQPDENSDSLRAILDGIESLARHRSDV